MYVRSCLALRGGPLRYKCTKKCSCFDLDSKLRDDHTKKNKKRKLNRSKRCKVVSKPLIPEELMFDILSFLPTHCLLNSARYVCKPWATTIRSFLFAEASLNRARFKPGLYVQNSKSPSSSYFLDIIDDVDGQFKFERRTDLVIPPKMGDIVGSCDGILLLRYGYEKTFVANPILKCWLRIPPLPFSNMRKITIARVPRTTTFKLFFIDILKVSGAFWYVFYALRIGIDNSLKEIARKECHDKPFSLMKPIYNGGNDLYYITREGITVVDVDKEIIIGEYSLPPAKSNYPKLTCLWIGDRLSCIVDDEGFYDLQNKTYQIYILDIGSGNWSLYHEMRPYIACGPKTEVLGVGVRLWINDQIIIQVYIKRKGETCPRDCIHFSYNVKTRKLKKIDAIAEDDVDVCLHTNSLVALPSTIANQVS